jgi:hypothetical protein
MTRSYSSTNDENGLLPRGITCGLGGYRIDCRGPLHLHHILNFSKARGNDRLRKLLAKNPPELTAMVCEAHNVGRWADTREARQRLLQRNCERYGEARVRRVYEQALGLLKVVPPEWRWEVVIDEAAV